MFKSKQGWRALPVLCLAGLAGMAAGADETAWTEKAYAAGYKAAFTCSAIFNAGKNPDRIAADELSGVYRAYAPRIEDLPDAGINRASRTGSVTYDDAMPPRHAVWRPNLGCTQLPVGAGLEIATHLPRITLDVPAADSDAPWTVRSPVNGDSGHAALDMLVAGAFGNPEYGRDAKTSAILIVTPTRILAEHYVPGFSPDTSQRTWSVAKSIAATIIGAAVERGILDVKTPAPIPEWQHPSDPRRMITLENLLHMASGLDSNKAGNRTDRLYLGGGLVTDTASRAALEAPPGLRWKYANNDTLLAVRALRAAMTDDDAYWRFPFEALFHRIGMHDTVPETDWQGNFILSSQVWTTARDLARLGLLYLHDGVWQGRRILPEGWARYVATPAPSQPPRERGNGSPYPGYGAQFWLYNDRFSEVPDDSFAMLGNRGQIVLIIPSRDMVIVRRGYDPAGGEGFKIERFARDVLAALDGVL